MRSPIDAPSSYAPGWHSGDLLPSLHQTSYAFEAPETPHASAERRSARRVDLVFGQEEQGESWGRPRLVDMGFIALRDWQVPEEQLQRLHGREAPPSARLTEPIEGHRIAPPVVVRAAHAVFLGLFLTPWLAIGGLMIVVGLGALVNPTRVPRDVDRVARWHAVDRAHRWSGLRRPLATTPPHRRLVPVRRPAPVLPNSSRRSGRGPPSVRSAPSPNRLHIGGVDPGDGGSPSRIAPASSCPVRPQDPWSWSLCSIDNSASSTAWTLPRVLARHLSFTRVRLVLRNHAH